MKLLPLKYNAYDKSLIILTFVVVIDESSNIFKNHGGITVDEKHQGFFISGHNFVKQYKYESL